MQTINIPKHNSLTDRDTAGNHAKIIPAADSTTALQITKANGTTAVVNVNTTDERVGIGTNAPARKVEISGAAALDGTAPVMLRISDTKNASDWTPNALTQGIEFYQGDGSSPGASVAAQIALKCISATGGARDLFLRIYDSTMALIDALTIKYNTAYIGIGTTTPSEKLEVNGTVKATAFSGPLTGNVTGNASGTAATVTGAAQPAITSVGTLTGLTVNGDASIKTVKNTIYAGSNAVAPFDTLVYNGGSPDTTYLNILIPAGWRSGEIEFVVRSSYDPSSFDFRYSQRYKVPFVNSVRTDPALKKLAIGTAYAYVAVTEGADDSAGVPTLSFSVVDNEQIRITITYTVANGEEMDIWIAAAATVCGWTMVDES